MPEIKDLLHPYLDALAEDFIPLTLNISKEIEEQAKKECNEYMKNRNKDVYDMLPLSVYYILRKLSSDEQVEFIQNHIDYISFNDEEIFLYDMMDPKSLSYYFSFHVLTEIRKLDLNIFRKMIYRNIPNFVHGFDHENYMKLYTDFYSEILEMENNDFIQNLNCHNNLYYDNVGIHDFKKKYALQQIYNKEFIRFILKIYKNKISTFLPNELFQFSRCIENIDDYQHFLNENYEKIKLFFQDISEYELCDYLCAIDKERQEFFISTFLDDIIVRLDIKQIIYYIKFSIIIQLYNQNADIFYTMTLEDWIIFCSRKRIFNDDFKKILDYFDIHDIECLFDSNFYVTEHFHNDVRALKYIEMKYRNQIQVTGCLENINENTSIFSEKYFQNLAELKCMLKQKVISKNDLSYQQHFLNFVLYLKNQNIIQDINDQAITNIETLFYRVVMGGSITVLYEASNIQEIALFNRIGKIDFKVSDFTVEQLERYNVKYHKELCKQFEDQEHYIYSYKTLVLKLIFMVGYHHAKIMLSMIDSFSVLEHLVGNVDVKSVVLDEQGNPILNRKIMNLLFRDKDYSNIREMLSHEDSDLYKYFPRIFSEWNIIKMNRRNQSLKTVLDFLKSDDISLPPKYYRLDGLFQFIGCQNSIVYETLSLHDQMLGRVESTIPRVSGFKDDYFYEVLKLSDMEGLSVGNKTDCCFTVLGKGFSCLKHAVTSKNGRIFVIRKNGHILAHSWLWRNGDLLCFDNIEISKTINEVDFFDVYLKFVDEMLLKSFIHEGVENCIKHVTIGFAHLDKIINGIEEYPCMISNTCDLELKGFYKRLGKNRRFVEFLPQPIEHVDYSDSKNVQYLIRGNGMFHLGQSNYSYQEERNCVMHYRFGVFYDDEYLQLMNKKINALRYMKFEEEGIVSSFEVIDITNLTEVYCNDDWYMITDQNECVECYVHSCDLRCDDEMKFITSQDEKKLVKKYDFIV